MNSVILTNLDIFDSNTSRLLEPPVDKIIDNAVVLKPEFSVFHEPSNPREIIDMNTDETTDYQRGIAAGEANATALNAATIATLQSALLNIQNSVSKLVDQVADDHFSLIRDCLMALCPVLMEQETKQALLSILKTQYVSSYSGVVTIQCHEDNRALVEHLCAKVDVDTSARFKIRATDSLSSGQFSINWNSGAARLDNATVAQEVLRRCRDVLPVDPCPNHTITPVMETFDDA